MYKYAVWNIPGVNNTIDMNIENYLNVTIPSEQSVQCKQLRAAWSGATDEGGEVTRKINWGGQVQPYWVFLNSLLYGMNVRDPAGCIRE
jgi:hypothetical protein